MKRTTKKRRKPLTDQQKEAARILFECGKIGETAAAVGVHRTTIWRWYKRQDFQREIQRAHDRWLSETRRRYRREWRNSPEHKRELAARRRLSILEKRISEAGNSGNMAAYRQACAAFDKCYNQAFGGALKAINAYFFSQEFTKPKKRPEPKKYIVEIID